MFDCALNSRKFYLPQDGEMKLPFFHVNDLCRFMDILIGTKPLRDGLQESLEWYLAHSESISRKPYIAYIDSQLKSILDIL